MLSAVSSRNTVQAAKCAGQRVVRRGGNWRYSTAPPMRTVSGKQGQDSEGEGNWLLLTGAMIQNKRKGEAWISHCKKLAE